MPNFAIQAGFKFGTELPGSPTKPSADPPPLPIVHGQAVPPPATTPHPEPAKPAVHDTTAVLDLFDTDARMNEYLDDERMGEASAIPDAQTGYDSNQLLAQMHQIHRYHLQTDLKAAPAPEPPAPVSTEARANIAKRLSRRFGASGRSARNDVSVR